MLKTLDSSILSFIILLFIYVHSYSRSNRLFATYKLFRILVLLNMAMIVINLLGWAFNGIPGRLPYLLNIFFNVLLYIAAPMIPTAWVLYTYHLVDHPEQKIKKGQRVLAFFLLLNAFLSILSSFTGWFFTIDPSNNMYHRGALFLVHVAYSGFLLSYSFLFLLSKRRSFQKGQFRAIMVFFIAPIIGSSLQVLRYGVSYNWTGTMLSLLIIYFHLQSRNLNTDHLTGIHNRLHVQEYLREKIRYRSDKRSFGGLLIDIDHFKSINDRFGHGTGDEALKDAVHILQSSLRRDDFIARYGGDEFLVIVDAPTKKNLEDTVSRIKDRIHRFNQENKKPYTLDFSFGADLYDTIEKPSPDAFIDHLDQLMYLEKQHKHRAV